MLCFNTLLLPHQPLPVPVFELVMKPSPWAVMLPSRNHNHRSVFSARFLKLQRSRSLVSLCSHVTVKPPLFPEPRWKPPTWCGRRRTASRLIATSTAGPTPRPARRDDTLLSLHPLHDERHFVESTTPALSLTTAALCDVGLLLLRTETLSTAGESRPAFSFGFNIRDNSVMLHLH